MTGWDLSVESLLGMLAEQELVRLASRLGVVQQDRRRWRRRELVQAVAAHICDEVRLERQVAELDAQERTVLSAALLRFGGILPYPLLVRHVKGKDGRIAPVREVAERLEARALLFPAHGQYVVPVELRIDLGSQLLLGHGQAPVVLPLGPDEVEDKSTMLGPLALGEFVRLLGALHRNPARITQKGVLYKKDIERLHGVLHPLHLVERSSVWLEFLGPFRGEPLPWSLPWQEYGNHLGFLLWFAAVRDLVVVENGQVTAKPGWAEAVARHDSNYWWSHMLHALLEVFAEASQLIVYVLTCLRVGGWFSPKRFLDLLEETAAFSGRDAEGIAVVVACLWMLGRLGVVEVGRRAGEALVRWTPEAEALLRRKAQATVTMEERFLVQPSGDVLAPAFLKPSVLAQLELFAEPVRVDNVSTYRLRQDLVARSIDQGLQRHAVLDFLVRHCRGELPQPVAYMVREWTERAGRLGFVEATLLACESAEVADTVAKLPEIQQYLVERIAPTHFIVAAAAVDRLRSALKKAGLPPKLTVQRPGGGHEPKVHFPFDLLPSPRLGLLAHAENFRSLIFEPQD